jgi:predicted ABC-type ATPase
MPKLVLFAGPNGSGKSSITLGYREQSNFPSRYINADEIAKVITGDTQEERERSAFREARKLRQTYREQGYSFAFETVFSHPSTLMDIQECRKAGFIIQVVFVTTTNAEINVIRIKGRVQAGGHDVPEDKIRSRYERSLGLLPRIVEESDAIEVFDNSGKMPVLCLRQSAAGIYWEANLSSFWEQRLREPLQNRAVERETLGHLLLPNEPLGEYLGKIISVGAHYVVQETQEGTIRHDRLLLLGTPAIGQNATITYKDMQGTLI